MVPVVVAAGRVVLDREEGKTAAPAIAAVRATDKWFPAILNEPNMTIPGLHKMRPGYFNIIHIAFGDWALNCYLVMLSFFRVDKHGRRNYCFARLSKTKGKEYGAAEKMQTGGPITTGSLF